MSENNKEATLNYIDKSYNSLMTVGKILHSNVKWNFVLSFLLILLSTGEIKPSNTLSFMGLEFQFSLTLLLIILSCIVSWLLMQIVGLLYRENEIRDTILRLYKEISFEDRSMLDEDCNLLEYPSYLTIPFRDKIYGSKKGGVFLLNLFMFFEIIIIFFFPLIIQIIIFVKLIKTTDSYFWISAIYFFLLLISSIAIYRAIRISIE